MSYTSDNPPEYIIDIIKEYNLDVKECGYIRGSWVNLYSEELGEVKFKLSPPTNIEVRKGYYGSIEIRIPTKDGTGLYKKNQEIRNQLNEKILGHETFKQALQSEVSK